MAKMNFFGLAACVVLAALLLALVTSFPFTSNLVACAIIALIGVLSEKAWGAHGRRRNR